jgi:hypothetical protein
MLQIDVNVEREVLNHKTLVHPNIVQFREVRSQALHTSLILHVIISINQVLCPKAASHRMSSNNRD